VFLFGNQQQESVMVVNTLVRVYPGDVHVAIGHSHMSLEELTSILDILQQDHGKHIKEFTLTQEIDA
jgi:hypothetical protein